MFADNVRLMNKHNEFMPSSALQVRGREIERITRPFPQFYRIVLRSTGIRDGSVVDATFKNIVISERFSTPATLQVESFHLVKSAGNADLANQVYEIRLLNFNQPRSFDSTTDSTTNTVAVLQGHSFYQTNAVHNTGIPILDPMALQNQPLRVQFMKVTSTGEVPVNFDGQEWVLVLNVVAFDDSVTP